MDATTLLSQLAELGRHLDREVDKLGEYDMIATGLGCEYQRLREEHEDELAESFLSSLASGVEARKMESRLRCVPSRLEAQKVSLAWEKSKSELRTQQAAVRALTTRIEIGRSLLSHEKALMGLGG